MNPIDRSLYEKAEQHMRSATQHTPTPTSWGLFTTVLPPEPPAPVTGFFLWAQNEAGLLDQLVQHVLYWSAPAAEYAENLPETMRACKKIIQAYQRRSITLDDLLFRLNGWLAPAGAEMVWMGPFGELQRGHHELPRRARLHCRRTLADMEDYSVDPLSVDPIEEKHLPVFMACLGDFGLEGQGLE